MGQNNGNGKPGKCAGLTESEIKQRIFGKVARRMRALSEQMSQDSSYCSELNPDVIVISGEQTMLFEPQNLRVVKWLHRRFGMEDLEVREQIRVHPARCQMLSEALRAAGFEVSGWETGR